MNNRKNKSIVRTKVQQSSKKKPKKSRPFILPHYTSVVPDNEILKLLSELDTLDLSQNPENEVRELLNKLGKVGLVVFTLHKGKTILRASRNDNPSETFNKKGRVSYLPASLNTEFQRASTPYQTMFYGSVVPEKLTNDMVKNARITCYLEVSKLMRDKIDDGREKLTYSRWIVTNDIPLIAIMYKKDFAKRTAHVKEIYQSYNKFLRKHPKEIANSKAISEYLANQFGKEVNGNQFDYMISAIYSEMICNKGLAGVYYPSVRADGRGFNVAIAPSFVDKCMELVAVGECTAYKKGKKVEIDNDTICEVKAGQLDFEVQPITGSGHIGEAGMLKRLEMD